LSAKARFPSSIVLSRVGSDAVSAVAVASGLCSLLVYRQRMQAQTTQGATYEADIVSITLRFWADEGERQGAKK
jgi:hypothetical protein